VQGSPARRNGTHFLVTKSQVVSHAQREAKTSQDAPAGVCPRQVLVVASQTSRVSSQLLLVAAGSYGHGAPVGDRFAHVFETGSQKSGEAQSYGVQGAPIVVCCATQVGWAALTSHTAPFTQYAGA
jgi:hypothetical protein